MVVAVTHANNEVYGHFGHTEEFKIYNIENNSIAKSEVVSTNGAGHETLVTFLKNRNVDTLICGGIGKGAKDALSAAGIKFYPGVTGNVDDAVNALLENKLQFNPNEECRHHHHHGHGEGHGDCQSHGRCARRRRR